MAQVLINLFFINFLGEQTLIWNIKQKTFIAEGLIFVKTLIIFSVGILLHKGE